MRPSRLLRAAALAAIGSGAWSGCVYYNTLYNAEDLYRETEALRLAGQDSVLSTRYREVVAKAEKGYAADPEGDWADDALILLAKAQIRLGDVSEADATLDRVLVISDDSEPRAQATLYRGAIAVSLGETSRGILLLNEAIGAVSDPDHLAEGYLWRARALFTEGMVEEAWRDLDRAANASRAYVVAANFERVTWGFTIPDLVRIHQGIQELIFTSRAEVHGDSIRVLAKRFADRWGPLSARVLLDNAENAHWSRAERDRLVMTRASFAYEGGDRRGAERDAGLVGSGLGPQADAARVTLARWRLARAEQMVDLAGIRALLLPAVSSEVAQTLLNAMRRVELLTEYGAGGEAVALIGAAEIARDVLGAGRLSAGLFLAHASAVPDGPWSGKALLASRALTTDPKEWDRLGDQLQALPRDPYVRYAHVGPQGPELGDLESRLQEALDPLMERVDEELVAQRQFAGVPEE